MHIKQKQLNICDYNEVRECKSNNCSFNSYYYPSPFSFSNSFVIQKNLIQEEKDNTCEGNAREFIVILIHLEQKEGIPRLLRIVWFEYGLCRDKLCWD